MSDIPEIGEDDYEIIEEGAVSTVSRIRTAMFDDSVVDWYVVKSAPRVRRLSKEPHDIVKELHILSNLNHPNIIPVLDEYRDVIDMAPRLNIWLPYIPLSLTELLESPLFSPHPLDMGNLGGKTMMTAEIQFDRIAQSIMFQTLSAIAYLHSVGIAHRDIKPNNVLLTLDGCVQLIDFGISWKSPSDDEASKEELWPEPLDRMYFEVSTGPYRAPELLFGTRSYDPCAIDLWSLGATFAEFFTSLRLCPDDEDEIPNILRDESLEPFVIPNDFGGQNSARWARDSLFDGRRGDIGLAWSIFKIRGSPTPQIWPEFDSLPDARSIVFKSTPPIALSSQLPNLPKTLAAGSTSHAEHFPGQTMVPSPLDLLLRLLVYPPQERIQAAKAISHPWFAAGIFLPADYPNISETGKFAFNELEGKTLGQFLRSILS